MKTLIRITIILAVVLAVTIGIYAAGQSEWVTQQIAGEATTGTGGESGRPTPDYTGAAATLGVDASALAAALGGFPPNYAQAAATLGIDAAAVQSAVEGSLGAMMGQRGAGHEGAAGGFQIASMAGFGKILLQIALVVMGVSLIRMAVLWGKRRQLAPVP